MTVKLWGVDRLHLSFDYHSESNSVCFSAFCSKSCLFLNFLFMKLIHIQVFKKECMKLE